MLLAAAAVVVAALLILPASPRRRLARLNRRFVRWPARRWVLLGVVVVITVTAVVGVLFGTAVLTVLVCVLAVGGTVTGFGYRRRSGRQAQARRDRIADACQLLAGMLRVGHLPATALRLTAEEVPDLADAFAAHQVGGSIPQALREQARQPGAEGLADLATAWEVCLHTGASLTTTLDTLSERLDSARKLARILAAELAAPLATGRMLAVLPFAGVALGYGIGGDPGGFLLGSPLGQVCLVLGVALACGGAWWIELIAGRVGR